MRREIASFLWDIQSYGGEACEWAHGLTEEQYDTDRKTHAAIERVLQNVGEALAQLARVAPEIASQLPDCRQVIGFRNVLVHGYDELDSGRVLAIIRDDLPKLIAAAAAIHDRLKTSS